MSLIDKVGIEAATSILKEERLPVVGMLGAYIHKPRQPETDLVAYPIESSLREDLEEAGRFISQEAGSKAQTGGWFYEPSLGLKPALRISIEEGIGEQQWLPRRRVEAASAVKLGSGALIEKQVFPLRVAGEFDDIKMSVACLRKNGLGASTKPANELRDNSRTFFTKRHYIHQGQPRAVQNSEEH